MVTTAKAIIATTDTTIAATTDTTVAATTAAATTVAITTVPVTTVPVTTDTSISTDTTTSITTTDTTIVTTDTTVAPTTLPPCFLPNCLYGDPTRDPANGTCYCHCYGTGYIVGANCDTVAWTATLTDPVECPAIDCIDALTNASCPNKCLGPNPFSTACPAITCDYGTVTRGVVAPYDCYCQCFASIPVSATCVMPTTFSDPPECYAPINLYDCTIAGDNEYCPLKCQKCLSQLGTCASGHYDYNCVCLP